MQSSIVAIVYSIGYLIAIIAIVVWFWKIKKRGEKIPLGAKIFVAFIILSGPSVIAIMLSPSPSPVSDNIQSTMYYIKPDTANVRECPSASCKILSTLSQNTELTFPGDLFDKYPDWAEITFPDGEKGYVSKTVLSENVVSASPPSSDGDPSSTGGVAIGPWDNIRITVGESYEFHFCEPPSAISGATCGGLAGMATDPTGGRPPYSFVKSSGFLPPGMALELNGTLSGSPTKAGTYNFRLCAKDLYGGEGCQNIAVAVDERGSSVDNNQAPSVSLPPPSEEVSASVSLTSVSCTRIGTNDTRPVYRLEYSGTASSPIDFYLDIDTNPACLFGNAFPNTPDPYFISNWTPNSKDGWRLDRKAGDPETTSWTWINEGFCYRGEIEASAYIRDNEYRNPKANSGATILRCP